MTLDRRTFLQSTLALAAAAEAAPQIANAADTPASPAPDANAPWAPKPYRRITTEECFNIPEIIKSKQELGPKASVIPMDPTKGAALTKLLLDVEEGRLAEMDRHGISMQVLSLQASGVQHIADADRAVKLARLANDFMVDTIRKHPTRYAGLASVAPQNPNEAAKEIERAMTTLKLNGVIINSHTFGEYLDEPKFTPIIEALVAHNAPLYIHPRELPEGIHERVRIPGTLAGWEFQVETSFHAIRLITSGVLDRYPTLQIVLGHMGEGLPFWIDRIDNRYKWEYNLMSVPTVAKRLPSEYLRTNFHITTSGMNYWKPLKMTIDTMGIDRVLLAIDYPLETEEESIRNIDAAPLSEEDRAKFLHGNAERLFKINTVT